MDVSERRARAELAWLFQMIQGQTNFLRDYSCRLGLLDPFENHPRPLVSDLLERIYAPLL
jgi:hypothetical protein